MPTPPFWNPPPLGSTRPVPPPPPPPPNDPRPNATSPWKLIREWKARQEK